MGCNDNNKCTDGLDGLNSFTYTSANFTQPAVGSNVTVNVNINGQNTGLWTATGQIIYIQNGGYYEVVSHSTLGDTITVKNLGYPSNAIPTAVVASGSAVSPSGVRGEQGATGATGAAGAAGNNGVSVLYNATSAETKSGTSADIYTAYSMPQATFAVNGSELDIDALFTVSETHWDFDLIFRIGSVDLLLPTLPGLPISSETKITNFRITGTIKRISATSVKVIWTIVYLNNFTPILIMGSPTYYTMNYTAPLAVTNLDSGGSQNVFFKRGPTVGAQNITMEYFTVRYANKA